MSCRAERSGVETSGVDRMHVPVCGQIPPFRPCGTPVGMTWGAAFQLAFGFRSTLGVPKAGITEDGFFNKSSQYARSPFD
jgi:hypothetical protein